MIFALLNAGLFFVMSIFTLIAYLVWINELHRKCLIKNAREWFV